MTELFAQIESTEKMLQIKWQADVPASYDVASWIRTPFWDLDLVKLIPNAVDWR